MNFGDIHELLVSSVRRHLSRDLIKFIVENNDSQAYVEGSMKSNAVAKFFKHENVSSNGIQNSQ